jgi:hypothetical protein
MRKYGLRRRGSPRQSRHLSRGYRPRRSNYGHQSQVSYDDYRDNPLKKSSFDKKLKKLKTLGLTKETAEEIANDFNTEHNDSTHSLYILDWWMARLALIKFLETDDNKYLSLLTNYAHKYKVDKYDLALDDVFQLDHYNTLRHFAHLADTNPYFRMVWPRLHEVTYDSGREWSRVANRYTDGVKTVVGEIREWDSKTQGRGSYGEPAIKIVTGANRAQASAADRIEKSKIRHTRETADPSAVIAFLKDMEDNVQTSRFFEPERHEVLLSFPDGKDWVVIDQRDIRAEGSSLRDCATAENRNTILISLREPVTKTHYQALLKAEIVFPSIQSAPPPTLDVIQDKPGVIVQLRGYGNSKPDSDLHKYIVPLLQQKWLVHIAKPEYQSQNTFILDDLGQETVEIFRQKKRTMVSPKSFYNKFKDRGFGQYPARIKNHILDEIEFPVGEMLEILSAKRYNLTMRRKALQAFKKRLNKGTKYLRKELFEAAESLLFNTKNKAMIKDILDAFSGHKKQHVLFLRFLENNQEWLLDNDKFLLELIRNSLPQGTGTINRYWIRNRNLPKGITSVLQQIAKTNCEFVLKLLYELPFDEPSKKNTRLLLETSLDTLLAQDDSYIVGNFRELCSWFQEESVGWGRSQHRVFANEIPLSNKLLKQFKQLVKLSEEHRNDCFMDLALSIVARMSQKDKERVATVMSKPLFSILMSGNRAISRTAYKLLESFIPY